MARESRRCQAGRAATSIVTAVAAATVR